MGRLRGALGASLDHTSEGNLSPDVAGRKEIRRREKDSGFVDICSQCNAKKPSGRKCQECSNWPNRANSEKRLVKQIIDRLHNAHGYTGTFPIEHFLSTQVSPDSWPFRNPAVSGSPECSLKESTLEQDFDEEEPREEEHPVGADPCNRCFEKALREFAALTRRERTQEKCRDFYWKFSDRFRDSVRELEQAYEAMLQILEKTWVHHQNNSEIREVLVRAGIAASTDFRRKHFEDDRAAILRNLPLPEVDPERKNEPGRGLAIVAAAIAGLALLGGILGSVPQLLPVAFVGIALLIYAGRRHESWEKKRAAAYLPAWQPTEIFAAHEEHAAHDRHNIEVLAAFLVEIRLFEAGESNEPNEWASSTGGRWNPLGPLPALPSREISPLEAEHYVSRVILYLGDDGVHVTKYSDDGGVDVLSDNYAVQVKHQKANVGPDVVRAIFGVAQSLEKIAAVFARDGFTLKAVEFADANNILLFSYGRGIEGKSSAALQALEVGLKSHAEKFRS